MKKFIIVSLLLLFVGWGSYRLVTNINLNPQRQVGQVVDSLDGVKVYFNGGVNHVLERNVSVDGYNIGLKYQCVEFVKRYYFEHFNHRMPDTYGHAKSFFDPNVAHGKMNSARALQQFYNGQDIAPKHGDIIVFKPSLTNPYGHVAIVSKIIASENLDSQAMQVEIIQQNPGPFGSSRETYPLLHQNGWQVEHPLVVGWLRL